VPMQPIHRLAQLAQRADGGMEWACPQCGRYLIRYPNRELVVAAGVSGPAHIHGPEHRDNPLEELAINEFDQQFLHRHAMTWTADHQPS
jgi:hypothetical protein